MRSASSAAGLRPDGGADGLSDPRNRVTLLERQGRVGRKLLSTGNGRCNLSNRHASPAHYHGADPDFCRPALEAFPVAETLRFFHQLGLVTVEEPDGKLYPRSNTANSVLDVLRLALEGQPDRLTLGPATPSPPLKCRGAGLYRDAGERRGPPGHGLRHSGRRRRRRQQGGRRAGRLSAGQGLGHHRTALTPALVQLKTDPTYPRSLKGVKNTARITLRRGREVLAENHGEILFTEYGVSGPAIFEISRYAIGEDVTLSLDLWPEQSEADTAAWLRRRQELALRNRELTCGQAFTGALHSRLSQMAAKYAGLSPPSPLADAPEEALAALAPPASAFDLPVTGTCGFDQAQVTAGGLPHRRVRSPHPPKPSGPRPVRLRRGAGRGRRLRRLQSSMGMVQRPSGRAASIKTAGYCVFYAISCCFTAFLWLPSWSPWDIPPADRRRPP